MRKFILTIDAGYGESHEIIEAENLEKAEKEAYQMWLDEAQDNALYEAQEYTEELAEKLDIR